MAQLSGKAPDRTPVDLGSSALPPVAGTYYDSTALDVRGWSWVDFMINVSSNTGGSPDITEIEALVEFDLGTNGDWAPVQVEDVDRVTGISTLVALDSRDPLAGARGVMVVTVPVFGTRMRLRARHAAAAPNSGASFAFSAIRRN